MRPPAALSIAALDPSGADGLAADLKTFTALGVYGAAVDTAHVVTDDDAGVRRLPADPALVVQQLTGVLRDLPLDAVRVGPLASQAVAAAVAELLEARADELGRIIVDAEMMDPDGAPLVSAEAARVLRERLVPRAHVVVAGPLEAAQLLGESAADDLDAVREVALRIRALGVPVVVIRDVRAEDGELALMIAHPGGVDVARAEEHETRGASAALSAAIAAQYARIAQYERAGELGEIGREGTADDDLTIIASAQGFMSGAAEHAGGWELLRRGPQPVNHLITLAD